jgi:hypothetical protein
MQRPETILINERGSDPFPFLKDAWNIFSKKGKKTVFISIGSSKSAMTDMEIAETIGCRLIVVPGSEAGLTGWIEVAECLKTHEPVANPKSDFSKGADDKWILPKNVRIHASTIPWWKYTNTVKISETYSLKAVPFFDWVQEECLDLGLTREETRIDILKIDIQNDMERSLIYATLDAGFRPCLILVNWTTSPDTNLSTLIVAGHLQNSGYVLVRKEGTKFLYMFVDSDMYTICSWENTKVVNPLVDEIMSEAKRLFEPVPEPVPVLTEEGSPPLVSDS